MSTVKVSDNITPSLKRIARDLKNLPKLAHAEFVKNTPIKGGNARRNTRLQGRDIVAAYPYARRLDEGYSKQSPQGMSKPTEAYVKRETDKIMRK